MKIPATTMVAAWISADTGVGPAIASGSQVWRMNWPDFDITAANSDSETTVIAVCEIAPRVAAMLMSMMLNVLPDAQNRTVMPTSRPMSPTRW